MQQALWGGPASRCEISDLATALGAFKWGEIRSTFASTMALQIDRQASSAFIFTPALTSRCA